MCTSALDLACAGHGRDTKAARPLLRQHLPGVGATRPCPCLVEQLMKEGNLMHLLRGRCTVRYGDLSTS